MTRNRWTCVVYGWCLRDYISSPAASEKVRLGAALWRTNIIAIWRRTCIRVNKVSTVIMTGSLPARRYGIWSANEWTRRTKGWLVRPCISVSFVNRLRIYKYRTGIAYLDDRRYKFFPSHSCLLGIRLYFLDTIIHVAIEKLVCLEK